MLRHTLCQNPPVGAPLFFLQVLVHPAQDLAESADAVGGLSLSAQAVVLTVEHAQLALHTMELERCEHFQTVGQRTAVILICVNKECGRLNTVGISNLSNKLQRESLRYVEAVQLADALGYEIIWKKRK